MKIFIFFILSFEMEEEPRVPGISIRPTILRLFFLVALSFWSNLQNFENYGASLRASECDIVRAEAIVDEIV